MNITYLAETAPRYLVRVEQTFLIYLYLKRITIHDNLTMINITLTRNIEKLAVSAIVAEVHAAISRGT